MWEQKPNFSNPRGLDSEMAGMKATWGRANFKFPFESDALMLKYFEISEIYHSVKRNAQSTQLNDAQWFLVGSGSEIFHN